MTTLKSLTFTTLPVVSSDPKVARRQSIVARLEEQKRLLNDPTYTKTIKTKDGEKQARVLPWFREVNGSWFLFVKAGFKRVEFQKGKTAIQVPSRDKLPNVIDTLIAAVRAGELDEAIAPQKKKMSKAA
jgi:hypothetical protein